MASALATPTRHDLRALTVSPATAGLNSRAGLGSRRIARSAAVCAAQGHAQERHEQKVVQKVMISAISAAAAVSLALTGPVSAIGVPVRNAAPDLSLSKDDELFGKAFQQAGIPGNANEAADSLKSKVSDAEPQGAKEAKGAASDAVRKAQNAAPDLSLAKDDEFLGKAFQKAGVPGNAPKAAENAKSKLNLTEGQNKAKGAATDAARLPAK